MKTVTSLILCALCLLTISNTVYSQTTFNPQKPLTIIHEIEECIPQQETFSAGYGRVVTVTIPCKSTLKNGVNTQGKYRVNYKTMATTSPYNVLSIYEKNLATGRSISYPVNNNHELKFTNKEAGVYQYSAMVNLKNPPSGNNHRPNYPFTYGQDPHQLVIVNTDPFHKAPPVDLQAEYSFSVKKGDINGDGKPDLYVYHDGASIEDKGNIISGAIYLQTADGKSFHLLKSGLHIPSSNVFSLTQHWTDITDSIVVMKVDDNKDGYVDVKLLNIGNHFSNFNDVVLYSSGKAYDWQDHKAWEIDNDVRRATPLMDSASRSISVSQQRRQERFFQSLNAVLKNPNYFKSRYTIRIPVVEYESYTAFCGSTFQLSYGNDGFIRQYDYDNAQIIQIDSTWCEYHVPYVVYDFFLDENRIPPDEKLIFKFAQDTFKNERYDDTSSKTRRPGRFNKSVLGELIIIIIQEAIEEGILHIPESVIIHDPMGTIIDEKCEDIYESDSTDPDLECYEYASDLLGKYRHQNDVLPKTVIIASATSAARRNKNRIHCSYASSHSFKDLHYYGITSAKLNIQNSDLTNDVICRIAIKARQKARVSFDRVRFSDFHSAQLDNVGKYESIRGREQQLIDSCGGVEYQCDGVDDDRVENTIRSVGKNNKRGCEYWDASNNSFGVLAAFTGNRNVCF